MTEIYFSSDYHIGHKLLAGLRGFKDTRDMDEYIIQQHNFNVKVNDTFYFLGDLSFSNPKATRTMLSRLNGKKYWLLGNHDKQPQQYAVFFEEICHYKVLKDHGKRFVMFHYPISSWHGMHKKAIHLHGHSHGRHKYSYPLTKDCGPRIDVGFDVWNAPVSLDQVIATAVHTTFQPVDHHVEVE